MNKSDRKELDEVFNEIQGIIHRLEPILEAGQERYDNMSEKAQEGDKGQALQEENDTLQRAIEYLENAKEDIESLTSEEE